MTLLLTTHDMDEAAELSDRVGIMDHGKLLALDTPEALMRSLTGETTLELTADKPADGTLARRARSLPRRRARSSGCRGRRRHGDALRVRLYLAGEAAPLVAPAAPCSPSTASTLNDVAFRHGDARGRLHQPHRPELAMSAAACRSIRQPRRRVPRRAAPRPLRHGRELPAFLAQVILQPLFLLFVFGKVLGSLGYTQPGYADLLFPGLLALTRC